MGTQSEMTLHSASNTGEKPATEALVSKLRHDDAITRDGGQHNVRGRNNTAGKLAALNATPSIKPGYHIRPRRRGGFATHGEDNDCVETVERLLIRNYFEPYAQRSYGEIEPVIEGKTRNALRSILKRTLRSSLSNQKSSARNEPSPVRYQSRERVSSTADKSEEDDVHNVNQVREL